MTRQGWARLMQHPQMLGASSWCRAPSSPWGEAGAAWAWMQSRTGLSSEIFQLRSKRVLNENSIVYMKLQRVALELFWEEPNNTPERKGRSDPWLEVVDGESVYVGGVLAAGSFGSEMGSRAAEVLSKTSLGKSQLWVGWGRCAQSARVWTLSGDGIFSTELKLPIFH